MAGQLRWRQSPNALLLPVESFIRTTNGWRAWVRVLVDGQAQPCTLTEGLTESDAVVLRRLPKGRIAARRAEDRIEFSLAWTGKAMPTPSISPDLDDLLGSDEARHAFAVWLAVRHAQAHRFKSDGDRQEVWFAFDD